MNTFKPITIISVLIAIFCIVSISGKNVFAVDVVQPVCENASNSEPAICKDKRQVVDNKRNPLFGPEGIVSKIVNILSVVIGVASIIVIIVWGGLRMMTSSGDPQKVASAKNTVIFAAGGLVLAAMAKVLVSFVLLKL